MRALLISIVYGAAGIGAYEAAQIFGVRVAAIVLAGIALVALFTTLIAWRIGEKRPWVTASVFESMPSLLCLSIGAAAGAGLIYASIALIEATGDHPSAPAHALSDAIGGLVVLAVSVVARVGELSSPRTFGGRYLCLRYRVAFAEQPASSGPRLRAYRAVRAACEGEGLGIRDLSRALSAIDESDRQGAAADS